MERTWWRPVVSFSLCALSSGVTAMDSPPHTMGGGPPDMMGGPPGYMGGPPDMMGGAPDLTGDMPPPELIRDPPGWDGGSPDMMGGMQTQPGADDGNFKDMGPQLTEEDEKSFVLPEEYKCDSCKAVIFQLNSALKVKQPKNRRLKGFEYLDVIEETCSADSEVFKDYGVTTDPMSGRKQLQGPGMGELDVDRGAPGIAMNSMKSGPTWTDRLKSICKQLIFSDVGEEEFYDIYHESFLKKGDLEHEWFCKEKTNWCKANSRTPKKAKNAKKENAKKGKGGKKTEL